MTRRLAAATVLAVLAAGGTALAQSADSDPYALPEPELRTGQVLALAGAAACAGRRDVRVRFTPPPGAVFGWFEVTVGGRRAVHLTGVARAASATVALPRGRAVVRVTGETLGGQRVDASRTYRSCAAPAAPPATDAPVQQGGGED